MLAMRFHQPVFFPLILQILDLEASVERARDITPLSGPSSQFPMKRAPIRQIVIPIHHFIRYQIAHREALRVERTQVLSMTRPRTLWLLVDSNFCREALNMPVLLILRKEGPHAVQTDHSASELSALANPVISL